jgi:Uma2 family endonuclease
MVGQLEPKTTDPFAPITELDISHIITEDDTPVANLLSEKQQRLLTTTLYSSFQPGAPFIATANVGLFYAIYQPPLVPDALLSLNAKISPDWEQKKNRSYFVWEVGKVPEVVIEIVSNAVGNELGSKLDKYAGIGVAYYVVFDPYHYLGDELLYVFQRVGPTYQRQSSLWLAQVNLGLTLWSGQFEEKEYDQWLRWCDESGQVLLTGDERAAQAQIQAEQAQIQAEQARIQAEQAQARAEKLAALLREQGIDPDTV